MVAGETMTSFSGIPPPFQRIRQRDEKDHKEGGMRSFVNGIVSPFTACWQPSMSSCVPACGTREYRPRHPSPSVVSPLVDRLGKPAAPTSPRSDVSHGYDSACASPTPKPTSAENGQPATDIEKPHSNDVLCGRGGSSNRHLGNMHFRELVAANKKTYVSLTKKQKMLVARKIVETVHSTEPPGRFLAKDLDSGLWYDIGLPRSLEKTSQALREKNSNDFPLNGQDDGSEAASAFDSPMPCSSTFQCGSGDADKRTKTSRRSKHVEAPPLIIPPHLKRFYCSKHPQPAYHEASWSEYDHQAHGRQIEQPYLHQQPPSSPSSTNDHYYVPPRTPSYHYETPPRSPPHYHYDNRAHYRQGHPRSAIDYEKSPDHREHYDYYARPADYRDRYIPHGRVPHGSRPPPPPQSHYQSYPPPRPASHYHTRPLSHPPTPPSHPHEHHYSYGHHSPSQPVPLPSLSSASTPPHPVIYRTPSNGYVRSKSEISPERRQEWKRQRNETGHARRLSDSSLSNAVEASLSIQDRASAVPAPLPTLAVRNESSIRKPVELTSPSGVLQSRSRRSYDRPITSSTSTTVTINKENSNGNKKEEPTSKAEIDVSKLSGLAALSTAAFLKMDET